MAQHKLHNKIDLHKKQLELMKKKLDLIDNLEAQFNSNNDEQSDELLRYGLTSINEPCFISNYEDENTKFRKSINNKGCTVSVQDVPKTLFEK